MLIADDLICDPIAFIDGRTELSLSEMGLTVLEADFGETDIEEFFQRAALGEEPVDRHPPNREIVLKLRVAEEGTTNLPTAAHNLQAKVGLWQQEGGWLGRDFKNSASGAFAGMLGCQVLKAALGDFAGWQRGSSPDVTLRVLTKPYWYADQEIESKLFEETSARELIWELTGMLGTAPGLMRVRVNNDNTSGDWRGLISAIECRDHPQDATAGTTAKLAYDAVALTRKGGATEAERESTKVVRHSSLTAGWLTILDSEITGVGHMTHKGVRRLCARIYDPGEAAGNVELKLRWRALGSLSWSENTAVPTPLVGGWAQIDLGECRPQEASLGDERWEFQIQARAKSGSGSIDIHRVRPEPVEQRAKVTAPEVPVTPDTQATKSPGTVADDSSVGTVAWTNPSNAKASDDTYATAVFTSGAASHYLKATGFGFSLPEEARIAGIVASIERKASALEAGHGVFDTRVSLVKGGVVGSANKKALEFWGTSDTVANYGASGDLWGETWTPADVNSSNFGIVLGVEGLSATASVDHIAITVYYTEASDDNRVCFAKRSIEFRTDGVNRQHATDEVWGSLVPEGFYPYAPPGGLEQRIARGIIVPSQGDLGELADSGSNKLSAQIIYRPAYHFAREAA